MEGRGNKEEKSDKEEGRDKEERRDEENTSCSIQLQYLKSPRHTISIHSIHVSKEEGTSE